LRADAEPRDDRPYLALNMVATADGRVTVGGRSGPIGNEADRALFHELRAQVDAVMAGAGTVRTERYGRIVRDPDRRARRAEGGPALNAGLLHEDLVDELYLALAPKLVAGVGPAVVDGPPIDPPAEMRLVSVMESGGHLFMRYRISA